MERRVQTHLREEVLLPKIKVATASVAICVDEPSPFLDRCVRSLRDQRASVLVYEGAPAATRNAALEACTTDVLAFVDPDVLVPEDWYASTRALWTRAPADRAVLGGAIGLRFESGRPAWLGDGLLTALGRFDEGTTMPAGNVSFRADALRGAGGFWPARGEPGQRDLFTEGHVVQHELHAAGWTGELCPELTAQRLIGDVRRRDVLRFRARYGARKQRLGEARDDARRGLLTSLAGVAAAGPRPALVMERAARAAEAYGALHETRFAHDALQPVEASTPFRPSVAEPQPRRPRRTRTRGAAKTGSALVLLYHRVAEPATDTLGLCVSPQHFGEQMEVLRDRAVPLGALEPGAVAVTFDDGYADNLLEGAPRLAGVPATFFVSTGHVEKGWPFWWDTVDRLVATAAPAEQPLVVEDRAWFAGTPAQRDVARRHLHALLQVRSQPAIEEAIGELAAWSGRTGAQDPRAMTIAELRCLARIEGVEIGAHSRTHRSLRWAPPRERMDELVRSRDDLASWLGEAPTAFSFPYGVLGRDVGPGCLAATCRAGFDRAVINGGGLAPIGGDPLAIPRVVAPDLGGEAFAAWVDGLLRP